MKSLPTASVFFKYIFFSFKEGSFNRFAFRQFLFCSFAGPRERSSRRSNTYHPIQVLPRLQANYIFRMTALNHDLIVCQPVLRIERLPALFHLYFWKYSSLISCDLRRAICLLFLESLSQPSFYAQHRDGCSCRVDGKYSIS